MALAGYHRERLRDLTFPVATALMEGGFVGVLADKVYSVHPGVLALISAAPMFGNLSSFLWARLGHGRAKVPLLVRLQLFFMAFVALIAFLPSGPMGATVLTICVVASRLVLGGIITLRSLIWTLNYPREASWEHSRHRCPGWRWHRWSLVWGAAAERWPGAWVTTTSPEGARWPTTWAST
ncbi:MAG: hypothetical protein ABFS46_22190 [Myxococcota bacterium]